MTIFYISDTHWDHAKIIEYSNRPFGSVEEMNEIMIQRWNEWVKPQDHVWHLGDVTMHRQIGQIKHRILDRLNGHKRLVLGNHDMDTAEHYLGFFEKVKGVHVHDNILFTHIPVHPESLGRFAANIHGHTHCSVYKPAQRFKYVNGELDKTRPYEVPYINLCVEMVDYRPVSLEEVRLMIDKAHE